VVKRRMSKRGRRPNGARKRRANPAGSGIGSLWLLALILGGVYLWTRPTTMKEIEF